MSSLFIEQVSNKYLTAVRILTSNMVLKHISGMENSLFSK